MSSHDVLDDLLELAEKQKREKAKIDGKIESLVDSLKEDGFQNLKSAQAFVDETTKKIQIDSKLYDEKLRSFESKFEEELKKMKKC